MLVGFHSARHLDMQWPRHSLWLVSVQKAGDAKVLLGKHKVCSMLHLVSSYVSSLSVISRRSILKVVKKQKQVIARDYL